MNDNPRKTTDLCALAGILADEANKQGIDYRVFSFSAPVLALPEGDFITITIRRSKAPERVTLADVARWLHIEEPVPA